MHSEPIPKIDLTPAYLRGMDAASVEGWMWALEYTDEDKRVAKLYCSMRDQGAILDTIASEIGWPTDAVIEFLEQIDTQILLAKNKSAELKANPVKLPEIPEAPRRHPVIERAVNGRESHPSRQQTVAGWAIHSCSTAKPHQISKFFSKNPKDQASVARRFCTHCPIEQECQDMAVEKKLVNAVYGGEVRLGLLALIRQRERAGDKSQKKTKKNKKK